MASTVQDDHPEVRGLGAASADGMRKLVRWASAVELAAIPEPVRRRAALVLVDNLAAVLAARDEPELRRLHDQMLGAEARPEATVFRGGRPRTDRYSAAVANGAAADWCELDEGYRKAPCHAGLCVLPALWAEAEAGGSRVEELLRALVIGYEVVTRVARAFPFEELTLHPHATLPAVGAAAGIAAVRRIPAEAFLTAVTGASTMVAPGPFDHAVKGALVRNVWAGVAAWIGLRSVDWAGLGIGGVPSSPHEVFVTGLGAEARPEELIADLGETWGIEDGYHKRYACCQYAHSAVEAVEALNASRPEVDAARDIDRIVVETHWRGLTLSNARPTTSLAAKFSMPHIVAAATHLKHAGADAFSAASLNAQAIVTLRMRVELEAYEPERPWPEDRPARVSWVLKSGECLQAECLSARGGPDRPFAPSEILDKVRAISAPVYPRLAGLSEALVALETELLAATWEAVVGRMTDASA